MDCHCTIALFYLGFHLLLFLFWTDVLGQMFAIYLWHIKVCVQCTGACAGGPLCIHSDVWLFFSILEKFNYLLMCHAGTRILPPQRWLYGAASGSLYTLAYKPRGTDMLTSICICVTNPIFRELFPVRRSCICTLRTGCLPQRVRNTILLPHIFL